MGRAGARKEARFLHLFLPLFSQRVHAKREAVSVARLVQPSAPAAARPSQPNACHTAHQMKNATAPLVPGFLPVEYHLLLYVPRRLVRACVCACVCICCVRERAEGACGGVVTPFMPRVLCVYRRGGGRRRKRDTHTAPYLLSPQSAYLGYTLIFLFFVFFSISASLHLYFSLPYQQASHHVPHYGTLYVIYITTLWLVCFIPLRE